ncbi:aminopeptidase N [Litoreibacter janthinus]|uniref:Aminopeptidase N n=1 Tax=Litoreibacter janthinus TaxID=670154 RepID=A0A1I6GPL3_9RHOB|nr:aminopeptidase N [Litoreibacter janthinus]SFR43997.1 aminopeptidase N [Litoreibacter janthinus]
MKDASPATPPLEIFLSDYTPPAYLVDTVDLTFKLDPTATRVLSKIAFRPNPDAVDKTFYLHGEQLKLISATIDGKDAQAKVTDLGLTAQAPDAPFIWEAEVEISPSTNTALEGLYMSKGMYCTQCEAEGFRKITYYPDRPDVMGVFTVTIEGSEKVKLSNGNDLGDGKWHDPWPKPAYLFALVAGDLVNLHDTFTTKSGRHVDLNIYVRDGDLHKTAFGMDALKRSMTWDEEVYGREYDLDLFNIVAVDDFNMGAMENKGLNIFNSSAVLASPDTSTDGNFARIETIIAHEYFHNWTGNRITCRDWFQLCLKEGLTVFRDQQFSGDTRGHAVERINDVLQLRARQFREDNGPLAHPVRPESFVEINNFYTATVYEKGAEVIGMLKTLIGDDAYYKGCELYFTRHDGQACTIEDWLKCFEDTTGRDLTQFKLWYQQAGTPRVKVGESYKDGTYTLTFTQSTPATPGQDTKDPRVIPIAVGLLNDAGEEIQATRICEVTDEIHKFRFTGLDAKPVPSINRGFSAPIILERDQSNEERAFLLAHDTDPFNKWESGRALGRDVLVRMVTEDATPDQAYLDALEAVARDDTLAPDFKALCFSGPSNDDIQQALVDAGVTPDPTKIFLASQTFNLSISQSLQDLLPRIYAEMQIDGPYRPVAEDMGKRDWGNAALAMLSRLDGGAQAAKQFATADNMTQQLSALGCLLRAEVGEEQNQAFYDQWKNDRLVMDKWFSMQVMFAKLDAAPKMAKALTEHPDFDMTNPNRFRAVFGALAGNTAGFHSPDGSGYALLADWLIKLDAKNPQTAARMSTAYETWKRYDADRQGMMRDALERIKAAPKLSGDLSEMVTRILNA